jgi:hypothetical protein
MTLTLYTLADSYMRVQEMLAAGEIDDATFADTMKSLEGDIVTKCDNIGAILRSLELEGDAFRFEEQRLAERRKAVEANRERLRRYAQFELEAIGMDKVKGPRFYLTIQNNPHKLIVDDETKLPPDFWTEVTTRTLDKPAVSAALKAGTEVPGAHLEQGRSLRVK